MIPAGRDEARGEVRQRREHEQALGRLWVRDHQQPGCLAGIQGQAAGRAVQGQPGPAEDEEVEIELPGPPALPLAATERALDPLQGDEERRRAGCRVGPGRDFESDRRVPELGLILEPDRLGGIEAGHAAKADVGEGSQGPDARGQRGGCVAEVRPQADIGSNPPHRSATLRRYTRPVTPVVAIILHGVPGEAAGPLEVAFASMRAANARRLAGALAANGAATTIEVVRPGGPAFGARLHAAAAANPGAGIVLLGSGSVPLATRADVRAFVEAAAADGPVLTNNRYSADILAMPASAPMGEVPDVAADNGLPRWFSERAVAVADRAGRWRLQVDLDSPLDGFLVGLDGEGDGRGAGPFERIRTGAERIRAVAADPAAELLIQGRTSAASLRWLERSTASRTRALVEERGMRTARPGQRPARSVLGLVLDREGPAALGAVLAGLGDAAIVDARVLLAHRLGADETAWPAAEDRFASDLLLHEGISDPWLRDLTRAAAEAPIPVLIGGHTLVGPGLRLLIKGRRA